jgi:hypothetical protein
MDNSVYIEEERGKCIRHLLLKFSPGYVQRHCPQFNTPPAKYVYVRIHMCGRGWGMLSRVGELIMLEFYAP